MDIYSKESVANRIKELMTNKNMNQSYVSEAIGANKSTVSRWLAGNNVPKNEYLMRLSRLLETSPEWIVNGEQPSYIDYSADSLYSLTDAGIKRNRGYLIKKLGLNNSIKYDMNYLIELNGGDMDYREMQRSYELDEEIKDIRLSLMTGTYLYTNDSDAMLPKVYNNAVCVINADKREVKDGKMYYYRHGELYRLRYIHKTVDGGLIIRCENDKYDDELLSGDELDNLEILGWVQSWTNHEIW